MAVKVVQKADTLVALLAENLVVSMVDGWVERMDLRGLKKVV